MGSVTATRRFTPAEAVSGIFNSSSPYNQTLAQKYGATIPIHPDNDLIIESIRRSINFSAPETILAPRYTGFRSDPNQFAYPIYYADETTPRHTVAWSGARALCTPTTTTMDGSSGTLTNVPIDPATFKPAPPNLALDSGSDSQLIIIDGDDMYDFWRAAQVNTGDVNVAGEWATNGSGQYVVENCSKYTGILSGTGVLANTPDTPVSRGAGVPYISGLVRGEELAAAVAADAEGDMIPHAIAFAYSSPDNTWVSPATKSDGAGIGADSTNRVPANGPYSMPQGAFLMLSEHFDVDSLPTAEARVIARAMQTYGLVCIDNTANPKIILEHPMTAGYAVTPDAELIKAIPLECFRVVDWTV